MTKQTRDRVTLYALLRTIVRFFAGFLVMIIAIVVWRRFWVEGATLGDLAYGEKVSLGLLGLIALGLMALSGWISREIRKR